MLFVFGQISLEKEDLHQVKLISVQITENECSIQHYLT